jgi:hypothetical protein
MKSKSNAAPKGNKYGLKLKDPDIRQIAYDDYCAHLAKGKSKRSWCFEHKDLTCTWETMEKYLKDETEFDPIKKHVAHTKGFKRWEGVVEDAAEGINKDANTASLQMLMRNKYGWDKNDNKELFDSAVIAQKQDDLMAQVKQYQEEASALRNAAMSIKREKKS